MRVFGLLLAMTIVLAQGVIAQESVGKAVVDGKVVILYGDGTWQFESANTECSTVAKGITFCSDDNGWEKVSNASADVAAMFRLDDRNYGMIIDELLGIADGLDKESMTGGVIYNVAVGAGIPESEVVTMEIQDRKLFDRDARTMIYGATVNGLDFIYVNSMIFSQDRTVQIITYSVTKVLTDELKETHQSFVSKINFE